MTDKASTLFLERRSYRQRRLMDAARLLPVVGALLWLVPLLWPQSGADPAARAGVSTSSAILYIFGVWTFVVLAALLVSLLVDTKSDRSPDGTSDGASDGAADRSSGRFSDGNPF
ncbi:MAG: hypothetical protein ACNA7Q_09265 [Rhodobacterales bacterium]